MVAPTRRKDRRCNFFQKSYCRFLSPKCLLVALVLPAASLICALITIDFSLTQPTLLSDLTNDAPQPSSKVAPIRPKPRKPSSRSNDGILLADKSHEGSNLVVNNENDPNHPALINESGIAIDYSDQSKILMEEQRQEREKRVSEHSCSAPTADSHAGTYNLLTKKLSDGDSSTPSIAFLFMTGNGKDRSMLDDMWERWFPPKEDPRYSIWIHTKSPMEDGTIPLGPFSCPYAIPSVNARHYWLHYGMMQLLKFSYWNSTTSTHFLFMSSTSIPLQTFEHVYSRVTSSQKSFFCLGPTKQALSVWNATGPLVGVGREVQSKAEMWSMLTRLHVRLILENEKKLDRWHNATRITAKISKSHVGAPDEMFFATLMRQHKRTHELDDCHGSVTEIDNDRHGCCTHYVKWDFVTLSDPPSKQTLTRKCATFMGRAPYHPCLFRVIREGGLRTVINDGFMFIRKVWFGATIEFSNGVELKLMEGMERLGIFDK